MVNCNGGKAGDGTCESADTGGYTLGRLGCQGDGGVNSGVPDHAILRQIQARPGR